MNKNMVYLDEHTVLVSDEEGNITKKEGSGNTEKMLETENKLENIKKIISDIQEKLEECDLEDEKCSFIFKMMVIASLLAIPTIFVGIPVSAIVGLIIGFMGSSTILKSVTKNTNKKTRRALNAKLDFANNLEREYKEELDRLLIEIVELSNVSKGKEITKESTPIKYSNGLDDSVIDEMNMAYSEAYSFKENPLVLTRKKKNK